MSQCAIGQACDYWQEQPGCCVALCRHPPSDAASYRGLRPPHHQQCSPFGMKTHCNHRLHVVPKRIVCTIGIETSTATRASPMQTLPLHVGVKESVQFAGEEHVVTTAAVATMVFPVKGTPKDVAVGSANWARGHSRHTKLPTRDWIYQIHVHFHATLEGSTTRR